MKNYIDEYFAKQGIKVIYNTLGHTDELIHTYIKESHSVFKNANTQWSNSIKNGIYNKFYSLKNREKKTGFEFLKDKDINFRQNVVPTNINDLWNYPQIRFDFAKNDNESYIDLLKLSLKRIENPLLFYSGGIDSELVLQSFLDIGIIPKVVFFKLVDTHNNIINNYDFNHAIEFCNKNSITVIIKTICPELLWDQEDFIKIGKELRIGSPQILTHIHFIKIISEEFKGHTYCFGGEVRYQRDTNHKDVALRSVLVSSAKGFTGLGAGTLSATNTSSANPGIDFGMFLDIVYLDPPSGFGGEWEILEYAGALPTPTVYSPSLPLLGVWSTTANPPAWNYQMKIDNEDFFGGGSGNLIYSYPSGYGTYFSPVANNKVFGPEELARGYLDISSSAQTVNWGFTWYLRNPPGSISPGEISTSLVWTYNLL